MKVQEQERRLVNKGIWFLPHFKVAIDVFDNTILFEVLIVLLDRSTHSTKSFVTYVVVRYFHSEHIRSLHSRAEKVRLIIVYMLIFPIYERKVPRYMLPSGTT